MITFYQLIAGCWVKVTTTLAYYHALRHIGGAVLAGCVAAAVVPPVYQYTPLPPMPERVRTPAPAPPNVYYPPGSLDNGPEPVRPLIYVPPVAIPEPSGLPPIVAGLGFILLGRRKVRCNAR